MSTAPYVYVSPKTRSWAMSAVILGSIFALCTVPSLFQYHSSVAMFGSGKAAISVLISLVSLIVAVFFVIGGASTMKGSAVGRETLSYAGAAGVVMNVLSSLWAWIIFHDPSYLNSVNKAAGAGGGSGLPANFFTNLMTGMAIAVVVVGILQAWYCIAIYRHMSADPGEMPLPPQGHYDTGSRPPPPQG